MFFSVIIGYVIAVAFAFCGIASTAAYVIEAPRDTTYTIFLEGLAIKMWPIALALALVLLIQTACQIERLRLTWAMTQVPSGSRSGGAARPAAIPVARPVTAGATPANVPDMGLKATVPIAPVMTPDSPETKADGKTTTSPSQPAVVPPPIKNPNEQKELSFFKLD